MEKITSKKDILLGLVEQPEKARGNIGMKISQCPKCQGLILEDEPHLYEYCAWYLERNYGKEEE